MKLLTMLSLTALLSTHAIADIQLATPQPVLNCTAAETQDGVTVFSVSKDFVKTDASIRMQTGSDSTATKNEKITNISSLTATSTDGFTKSITVGLLATTSKHHTFGGYKQEQFEAQSMDIDLDKGPSPWTISKKVGGLIMEFSCSDARPAK